MYAANVSDGELRVTRPTPSGDVGKPSVSCRAATWQPEQATLSEGDSRVSEKTLLPMAPAGIESANAFDGSGGGGSVSAIWEMRAHWSREKRPSKSTGGGAAGGGSPFMAASAERIEYSRASSVGFDR